MKDKSDSAIWSELKAGEREALRVLFERYYNELLQYAVKLSYNRSLAKDCVQELFYRIWDRRTFLGDITSVKAYLWVSLRRDLFKAMSRDEKHFEPEDYLSLMKC
ncbi:MAG: sigma factor [Balneolaceae bacterium]|nr:sigma factor [Balneolaceae bacterium]